MSADGPDEPGATLRLLTTPSTADREQAREESRALADLPGLERLAELDHVNATGRTGIGSLSDVSSSLDSLLASAPSLRFDRLSAVSRCITEGIASHIGRGPDPFGIEKNQKRMAALFSEFEESRNIHPSIFDTVTKSFEVMRNATIPGVSGMLGAGDPQRYLDESINERALRAVVDIPPNPIYETNLNLEQG